jgi:hypothetical protein
VAIQLAHSISGKIFATANSSEEAKALQEDHKTTISRVIDLSAENLLETLLRETANLGVDYILDSSGRINVSKQTLLRCLAVHGHWVTSLSDLQVKLIALLVVWLLTCKQLDPPDSKLLFMKGGKVSYLFEHTWTLGSTQQGRYLRKLLCDFVETVALTSARHVD